MLKVGFALYEKTLLTSITLVSEMLSSANQLRSRALQRQEPFSVEVITPKQATMQGRLRLQSDGCFEDFTQYDFVVLPPMWGNPQSSIRKHPEIIGWIQRQYQGGARIIATGTGVCWLAETGLLDGQVATTHWYFYQKFAKLYPQVKLRRDASTTRCKGLYCTRSINTQTELMVYLISQYFGKQIAKVIEQHYCHEVSSRSATPVFEIGGGSQFDEAVAIAQALIKQHFAKPLNMAQVAQHCGVSAKTLSRRFANQLGFSPHQYLVQLRMEQAKSLFRDLNLSITDIASIVGYQDAHYFGRLFQRHYELTPKQYRAMIRAKMFSGDAAL